MDKWPKVDLGNCAKLQEGYVNPSQKVGRYFDGPVKWLRAVDLNDGFVWQTSRTLTEEGFRSAGKSAYMFQPGTLAISKSGTIGRVGILKDCMCGNRAVINIAPHSDVVHPVYLFHVLRQRRPEIEVLAEGSVQRNLYVPLLSKLKISLPPIGEQLRIANLLGSLDDKIELNRRTNETLEAMAQAIFRDWFVDFGPTRRKIDGASDPVAIMGGLVTDPSRAQELADLFPDRLGDNGLPEGWERSALGDHFDVTMGQSPPGSTYNEIGEGLPFFQGRRDFQFRFPSKRVYCTAPTRIAEADWTLLSVRAPVGDINRAGERCCIGRGVGAIIHKAGLNSFTFYTAIHLKEELASYDSNGTVFGSINQKQLRGLAVVGAHQQAAETFDQLARPIDKLIRGRTREIEALVATRDLLLPKLMSGEIRIRDAEKLAEDAA